MLLYLSLITATTMGYCCPDANKNTENTGFFRILELSHGFKLRQVS